MEELNRFEFEYLHGDLLNQSEDIFIQNEEIPNSLDDNTFFSQLWVEGNIMKDYPSVWEQDTTDAFKKKFHTSSQFDKVKAEISLKETSLDNPVIFEENDSCLFAPELRVMGDENIEPLSKPEEKTETSTEDIGFSNPVKYENKERLSKKYDRGKNYIK